MLECNLMLLMSEMYIIVTKVSNSNNILIDINYLNVRVNVFFLVYARLHSFRRLPLITFMMLYPKHRYTRRYIDLQCVKQQRIVTLKLYRTEFMIFLDRW